VLVQLLSVLVILGSISSVMISSRYIPFAEVLCGIICPIFFTRKSFGGHEPPAALH